jgi:hypothetical protein
MLTRIPDAQAHPVTQEWLKLIREMLVADHASAMLLLSHNVVVLDTLQKVPGITLMRLPRPKAAEGPAIPEVGCVGVLGLINAYLLRSGAHRIVFELDQKTHELLYVGAIGESATPAPEPPPAAPLDSAEPTTR